MIRWLQPIAVQRLLAALFAFVGLALFGCEQREKVLEIETPNRKIEVERSKDTGHVDVDAGSPRRGGVEVETPGTKVEVKLPRGIGGPNVDVHTGK